VLPAGSKLKTASSDGVHRMREAFSAQERRIAVQGELIDRLEGLRSCG